MSEPLDIVEVLRRPLETISQCRRMLYVTAEVAEIAAAEIVKLREERRWVPVAERLPAVQGDDVLTARGPWEDGGYSIGIGWWNGECWMSYGSERDMPSVAFWQPLPPGPEGNGNG